MELDTLYYGDCLDWMQRWPPSSVDLIYLDPPFKSDKNYNQLFTPNGGGQAQYRAFADTWYWDEAASGRYAKISSALARPSHNAICGLHRILGETPMLAYMTYMAERLEAMAPLLKPTGCLLLHCDASASHYLKVLLDAVLSPGNFMADIIWKRYAAHSLAKSGVDTITDNILLYAKDAALFKAPTVTEPLPPAEAEKRFEHIEAETGRRYQHVPLEQSSNASSAGQERVIQGRKVISKIGWRWTQETFDKRLKENPYLIHWTNTGRPRYKLYQDEYKGRPTGNLWTNVGYISSGDSARLYPTQKPLPLLKRIITAFTKPGQVVLDPFCGCGTTVQAADETDRRWAGIDISAFAIEVIKRHRFKNRAIPTRGIPYDFQSAIKLAGESPFEFETWCVTLLPGFSPNTQQRGDGGVDGRGMLAEKPSGAESRLALAQVKGTASFNLSAFRDFLHVVKRHKAAIGLYVTLHKVTSRKARAEARAAGTIQQVNIPELPRVQLYSVEEYFAGHQPLLPVMTHPVTGASMAQGDLFA